MMKNKFIPTITKEEIYQKPLIHFQGNIHVIDNPEQAKTAICILKRHKVLGFDTETKPNFKKGHKNKIALLQLSSDEDAFLFRIFKYFPIEIIDIIESPEIIKVGAAIRDDLKGIRRYKEITAESFVDIQDYVKQFHIENNGLKKLAAIVLDSRISKGQQTSNWENENLTEAQMLYAATDAWICLEIYNKLKSVL